MEGGVLPLNTIWSSQSDSLMDLDYMDGLLLGGCWLETTGQEFPHFDSSTPFSPFEPSIAWPTLESNIAESGGIASKEDWQKSPFFENLSVSQSHPHVESANNGMDSSFQQNHSTGGSEPSKRWWIGPRSSTPVMDRLIQALGYIKDFSRDKNILIQVWIPVTRGGKRVLTTNNQPFSLDLNCCPRLAHYRDVSINFQFSAEGDSTEGVGLPGRVFRSKIPEWTPDVRFFSKDEYPRVGHARKYDICGSLAVPVLEEGTRSCLGVIEVVLTTRKIKYRPELESVCKALEAVDLKSYQVSNTQNAKISDFCYEAALPEISEVLRSACVTHGLPLAQTWVPCILQGKGGCRHSNDNLENCVSTVDSACHIGDSCIRGFHEASSEYHLLKGQGVVGKAFGTNQPCFSPDVTSQSMTEYPLSHHARVFGLQAAVAIRLRSICTGAADFVLEFFLPMNCRNLEEQKKVLNSLSTLIQNVCRTLRVVTDEELSSDGATVPPVMSYRKEASTTEKIHFSEPRSNLANHQEKSSASTFFQNGKPEDVLAETQYVRCQLDSSSRDVITFDANPIMSGEESSIFSYKTEEKKRIKAEKAITLQVLQKHFAGSLKDAARNLGVCPTTLKRICRQHGIQRWPSRKIKKVGRSLQKIRRVIDSVQGASGVLKIETFYSNFPELASPNASRTDHFPNSKSASYVKPSGLHHGCSGLSPPAATSGSPSSSCSQNSSSSPCYSNGAQPNSYSLSGVCPEESVAMGEYSDCIPKRTKSDANRLISSEGSQINACLYRAAEPEISPPAVEGSWIKTRERGFPRIKATFGEEKIRFRMQKNWGYSRLLHEISRRFGVDDTGYHLKYLDDDSEWVLLTCDADLVECVDVCHSSQSDTIKLSFVRDPLSHAGTSLSYGSHL